jgi:hypothetical protein
MPFIAALMVVVPWAPVVASPRVASSLLLMVATPGFDEDQVTELVMSCVLLSLKLAVAR